MAEKYTKYFNTQYNREKRLISKLDSMFSTAKICHLSSVKMNESFKEFYESTDFKKANRITQAYVNGYKDATRKAFDKENIVSAYYWKGTFYFPPNSWNDMPTECRQSIMDGKTECKLYYKGTTIVYFDDSMISEETK